MSEVNKQQRSITENGQREMRKVFGAVAVAVIGLMVFSSVALASILPGQKGYERQPHNQSGSHQAEQQGYEGQPGNQGGK